MEAERETALRAQAGLGGRTLSRDIVETVATSTVRRHGTVGRAPL